MSSFLRFNRPVYLPLPLQVFNHLETLGKTLTFEQRKTIALGLQYGHPMDASLIGWKIDDLTGNALRGRSFSIAQHLWQIGTNRDNYENTIIELNYKRFGSVRVFPSCSQVRRYLNENHSSNLTRSSRNLLANLIGKTERSASEVLDIALDFDPINAESLYQSLLSIREELYYDPVSEDLAKIESLDCDEDDDSSDDCEKAPTKSVTQPQFPSARVAGLYYNGTSCTIV